MDDRVNKQIIRREDMVLMAAVRAEDSYLERGLAPDNIIKESPEDENMRKAHDSVLTKTTKEVLREGSVYEKLVYTFNSIETGKGPSPWQRMQIIASFDNEADSKKFYEEIMFYTALQRYQREFNTAFLYYDIYIRDLADKFNRLHYYETLGEVSTKMIKNYKTTVEDADLPEPTKKKLIDTFVSRAKESLKDYRYDRKKVDYFVSENGLNFTYNTVDLWLDILKDVETMNENTRVIKAYAQVINDFLLERGKNMFMPFDMAKKIVDLSFERPMDLFINKKYLKSTIAGLKHKGKEVTPEQEQEAIIDDINSVEADAETITKLQGKLKSFLNGHD